MSAEVRNLGSAGAGGAGGGASAAVRSDVSAVDSPTDGLLVYCAEVDAYYCYAEGSTATVNGWTVLTATGGRWILVGGRVSVAPMAWSDFAELWTAAAYRAEIHMRHGTWTCGSVEAIPSGTTIVGNAGVRIESTLPATPGGSPDSTVFLAVPPVPTKSTTLASNTIEGVDEIELDDASSFVAGDEIALVSTNYVAGYSIVEISGDTVTVDRIVVHTFPAGTAVVDRIAPKDIRIHGHGMVITGTGDAAIEWSGALRCVVSGLRVTREAGSFSDVVVNFDVGARDCVIMDCDLDAGGARSGIHFECGERCRAERVWIRRPGAQGVFVSAGYGCELNQVHCESSTDRGASVNSAEGIIGGSKALSIVGCTFVGNAGVGLDILNGSTRIEIVNCEARYNGASGFAVNGGSGPSSDVHFSDCNSSYNQAGFYVVAGCTGVTLRGCTADHNRRYGLTVDGEAYASGYVSRNCRLGGVQVGTNGKASVHQAELSSALDTTLAAWAGFSQMGTSTAALRISDARVVMSGAGTKSCISSQAAGTTYATGVTTVGGTYGWIASAGTLRLGAEVDLASCATQYLGGKVLNAVALGVVITSVRTSNHTAVIGECVRCDPTLAELTVTLPSAANHAGRQVEVKNASDSTNTITISPAGSDLIDGATTAAISAARGSRTFRSTGAGWVIV